MHKLNTEYYANTECDFVNTEITVSICHNNKLEKLYADLILHHRRKLPLMYLTI